MELLITGCRGQLGSELQRQLSAMRSPLGPLPECYKNSVITATDLPELDLTDRSAVMKAITGGGYDLIINCAAFTNVDRCESDLDTAFRANALAPRYLAEAADLSGAKLVQVSTDYVFRGDAKSPRSECDITGPVTAYGKTKLLGEQYVRECCKRSFIVRTAWLYGLCGNNFVKTIRRVAAERGSVKVVDDQLGNPTSAVDLAHHILLLAATESHGLYHCTCGGVCSWHEFAREIVALSGIAAEVLPCSTAEYPSPTPRPAYSALEHAMLRATVGDGMRDWKTALAEYIKELDAQ